ncbi:MAG: GxxExxY protein [Verrucomicrobiota bacterium]
MDLKIEKLLEKVRQTAYEVHVYFKHGHLEKVYENALASRLKKSGIKISQQIPIIVLDEDGRNVGNYISDLLVEDLLLIELKTAKNISEEHEAQILGYLKSTKIEHGLLINFGSYKFQIKKYIWSNDKK